jgi:CheY-like chemotaxis protein
MSKRTLVVEDEPRILKRVRALLQFHQYVTLEVTDGEMAIALMSLGMTRDKKEALVAWAATIT